MEDAELDRPSLPQAFSMHQTQQLVELSTCDRSLGHAAYRQSAGMSGSMFAQAARSTSPCCIHQ